ncbi:sterol desaturase family protein [Undibacterium crateris]|uniref:sterol desaturase family protein n=1 Tax=Undibacterium crateris TaxID=2528175 RepID=UPI00138A6C85|nr:sterol desaturase family protein [Undibacterium crateris]NDI85919.1 fatty acid hydroxylase [Undibacterium crateris]
MEWFAYPVLLLVFVALFTREVIAPASGNACDKRWQLMTLSMGLLTVCVTLATGYVFGAEIRYYALLPMADKLAAPVLGFLSFLSTSFVFYWWHRATHASDFLWRHVHQLHHSARRIETLTAFFAHPLDTACATLISCLSSYLLFGATEMGAAWALLFTGVFDLYLHADRSSPTWLGYLIQRPEMHRVHHAYGHHAQNYGLPVWDMLFGTWHNPKEQVLRCGFDDEKSDNICAMLRGVDVHRLP